MLKRYPQDFDLDEEWSSLTYARVFSNPVFGKGGTQNTPRMLGSIWVIEWEKSDPLWKLPAGHKVPGETPQQTAQREFQGETGIRQPVELFQIVPAGCVFRDLPKRERSGPHWSMLFTTDLTYSQVKLMNDQDIENDNETPAFFTSEDLWNLKDRSWILPLHEQRLTDTALILPELRPK